ncbi:MAG: hypothetical protein IPK07_11570 [Deltaproteobacteria bacterium]|nr:hypothetical protein [Deltaproteobacteria bacterium]
MARSGRRSKPPRRTGPDAARAPLTYDPTRTGKFRLTDVVGGSPSVEVRAAEPPTPLPAPIQVALGPMAVFLLDSKTESLEAEEQAYRDRPSED